MQRPPANSPPPRAHAPAAPLASRWRDPALRLSLGFALASALSPAWKFWAAGAHAVHGPVMYPAMVATLGFALAGAFFIGCAPAPASWDARMTRTIAHLLGFALWALGFLMEYAVFYG